MAYLAQHRGLYTCRDPGREAYFWRTYRCGVTSKQELDALLSPDVLRAIEVASRPGPSRPGPARPRPTRSTRTNSTVSSSESAVAGRENRTCLSYGLTFGTPAYGDCRLRLGQQRAQKEYLEQARAEEDKRRRQRAIGAALTEMSEFLLKTGKYAPPPPAPTTRIEVRPQSNFTCTQRPIYRGLGSGGIGS